LKSRFSKWALVIVVSGLVAAGLVIQATAYEFPVHFTFTMWVAETAGFPQSDAFDIAKFDQATDDDPRTQPLWGLDGLGQTRRADYHFPGRTRLAEMERLAQRCPSRAATPDQFKRVGQYLHALEDTYAHHGYDAAVGHLFSGHTADKPWSHPAEFVAMAEAKFKALVNLRKRCFRTALNVEERSQLFSQAKALLEAWREQEYDGGTDDVDSPARFQELTSRLYGPTAPVYEQQAVTYQQWLSRMKRSGWVTR
jgi:hypothetical protein